MAQAEAEAVRMGVRERYAKGRLGTRRLPDPVVALYRKQSGCGRTT